MAASLAVVTKQIKVPASYNCAITGQIMVDPVFAADGHTYEREAIEEWLKTNDTSPKTNLKLKHKRLVENHDKRGDILEFLQKHPELYEKEKVYLPKTWLSELAAAIKANKVKEVQEHLVKDRRLLTLKLEGDYTALYLAAQFGSKELTNLLLEGLKKKSALNKVLSPPPGFKPIHLNKLLEQSLTEADKDKFSFLLKLGAELNQVEEGTQNTLLHKLVLQGNPEPVKWLLEKGLAVDSQNIEGNTPLSLATLHGRVKLTELLLEKGGNLKIQNKQNQTALSIALVQQNKPLLTVLVGAEKAALPPLHLALALNDLSSLKALLKQEQAKDALQMLDRAGHTPLYALVAKDLQEMKEKEEAAYLLLEAGADPTAACGLEKLTAFHLAAKQGDLNMLKLLLTTAADSIDVEDNQGNTPLHLAASAGQSDAASYLLEKGADHEARNQQGQTPIEVARSQHPKTAAVITQRVRALRRILIARIEQLEKEVAALKQKLSLAEEKERKEKEEQRGPASSFLPQYQARAQPSLKVTAEEVQKFLDYVVAGAQPEAEVMLKKNSDLALAFGTVTDHAKRTFKNITGFQYAVWALDWQMWRMIKSYLPKKAAQEQSKGFGEGSWVAEHGEHVDWKKLIEAQQTLIDKWQRWSWAQADEFWVKQVGGVQLLLPMHVLQEYNQPGRPFYPCPKFDTEYILDRTVCNWDGLSLRYGVARGDGGKKTRGGRRGLTMGTLIFDNLSLGGLLRTRIQQRAVLVAELTKGQEVSPAK